MSQRSWIRKVHEWLVPPEAGVGWTAYLWLIYFGFFFLQWKFQPPDPVELGLGLASTAVFLALYFSGYRRSGPIALLHCLALISLGIAWAPFNVGASAFFVFASAFAFLIGPPRQALMLLLAIVVVIAVLALTVQTEFFFWLPGILASVIVGAANIFFGEKERHNAELKLSQAEVRQLARVAERERIARDLHDLLGHSLSVIVLKSELARRLVEKDPQRAGAEMKAVEESARQALSEVREAIGGYRERSLAGELEQARLALASADIELTLNQDDSFDLDSRTEAVLALVIREAITNILRHARARRCRIDLQTDHDGQLTLTISDDGSGRIRPDGVGIDGMRARIEALGGHFRLEPQTHRLQASLPLEASS
ncbi:MAG: sensor histidine kinase [Wenzhouxiangella sp.]|nr:MAG: sensor histidine kinase [Wenzhouxiangella sp.]